MSILDMIGRPRLYLRFGRGIWRLIVPISTRPYWTHPGCTVHHERPDTAARCAAGTRGPITRHN